MKYFFILIFIISASSKLRASDFVFPKVASKGNSVDQVTPKYWHVIDVAYGDLNGDGLEDMSIIFEYFKEITESRTYGDNNSDIITEFQKPRLLAIYFKAANNDNYILSTQSNDFILRSEEGGQMGDPLLKMEIKNELLYLRFKGGRQWRWENGYTFKYINKDWRLSSAINLYYDSVSGHMTERVFDFETRQMLSINGNLHQRGIANSKKNEVLYFSELRTFKTFKKPWAWQILPDIYL